MPVRLEKCVQVKKTDGRDTLVNRCKVCRKVSLTRRRPTGKTINRSYTMPARSRQTLSFRGTGLTRITSDIACDEAVDLDSIGARQKENDKKCIAVKSIRGRGPAMFNLCDACRIVVVERVYPGRGNTNQTYTIGAKSSLPVSRHDARQIRIKSESSCN